jgi:hypothetical protein
MNHRSTSRTDQSVQWQASHFIGRKSDKHDVASNELMDNTKEIYRVDCMFSQHNAARAVEVPFV